MADHLTTNQKIGSSNLSVVYHLTTLVTCVQINSCALLYKLKSYSVTYLLDIRKNRWRSPQNENIITIG